MLATVHSSYYKRCPSGAGIIPDFLMNVPLTVLSEDEQLFRDSCRSFAQERIRPLVRKMDEEAKLEDSVIPDLFQLGLMGIHIPEEFGGSSGSLFIVFANAYPEQGYKGITAFLVERDFPGFAVGKKEDKLGIRASSTCELILEDCRVPKANILGELGKGYKIAIETLNEGRIGIGAQMVGIAQGSWEHGAAYSKQRKAFGKSLAEFQAVQF